MQHLHAYWRIGYVEGPKPSASANPFVELPALGDDRRALIVHRSRTCYLLLNRFPYNGGHLLAIPYRAVPDLEDLDDAERADLFSSILHGKRLLTRALRPDGFNIGFNLGGAAGAGIPHHLHAHIVPRWNGDTNFMPVLAETRVLPQALEALWDRLTEVQATLTLPAAGPKPAGPTAP